MTAVRGNNDRERWARAVPERVELKIDAVTIYVLHNVAELDFDPKPKYRVVVAGHSHKPMIEERDGVLYVIPAARGRGAFRCRSRSVSCALRGKACGRASAHWR